MKKAVCCLTLLFTIAAANGQTTPAAPLRLSLHDAISMALASGTQAQLAASNEERARIARREALGAMLPQADARVMRYSQSINLETFGFAIPGEPPVVGPFNVTDAQVSAAMQLFNVAAIRRFQSLQQGERASRLETETVDNEVAAAVARLYVLVQRADAQAASRRADVDLFTRLRDLAGHELEAGTGTRLDVAQANVQLSRAKQSLLVAENDRRVAGLALLNAVGAAEGTEVVTTDPLPAAPAAPAADEAVTAAKANRPDLRAVELHQQEARLAYQATRARKLPSLSADFEGDYSGNHTEDLKWTRRVAGVVSVPVLRSDLDANIARARIQLHDTEIQLQQKQRDVEQEVRRAIMNLDNANARVGVATESARVAEEALTIARERRAAGYGSPVEVDRAEDAYRQAREDVIAAQADAAAAHFELLRATGEIGALRDGGK